MPVIGNTAQQTEPQSSFSALAAPPVKSGLEDIQFNPQSSTLDEAAINRRSAMYAMAFLPEDQGAPQEDLMDRYLRLKKTMQDTTERETDTNIRAKAFNDEMSKSVSQFALMANDTYNQIPDYVKSGARVAMQMKLLEQEQKDANMAAEKKQVETLQELTATGRYDQAAMVNTLYHTPGAWQAAQKRQARTQYMQKVIEDAGFQDENRSWLATAIDYLMLGFAPMVTSQGNTGNVDNKYVQKGWGDDFLSGDRLRSEVRALYQTTDDEQFTKDADAWAKNVYNNVNNYGLWHNNVQAGLLSDYFMNGPPSADEENLFDTLDMVLAPTVIFDAIGLVKMGGKGKSLIGNLIRGGARKEAGDATAKALADIIEHGPIQGAAKSGSTIDEVEEALIPSALNPTANPHETSVAGSVVNDVEDTATVAKKLLGEGLPTTRLNEEELAAAKLQVGARAAKDFGRHVHDVEFDVVPLVNGSHVHSPTVVLGTKNGGLFVSKTAAQEAAAEIGLSSASVEEFASAAKTKGTVTVYHGGHDATSGGGRWVTTNLEDAKGWASRDPGMQVWKTEVPADDARIFTPGEGAAEGFAPRDRFELTAEEAAALKPMGVEGLAADVKAVPSENGVLYGVRVRLPLTESQFYAGFKAGDIKPKNFIWRFLLGSRQTNSTELNGLAEVVTARRQKIVTAIQNHVQPLFDKLGNTQKNMLMQILIRSEKEQTWYNSKELAVLWARLSGVGDDVAEITDTEIKLGNVASSGGAAVDPQFLAEKAFAELKDRAEVVGRQVDELVNNSGAKTEAEFWETATPEQHALNDERRALAAQIAKGPQVKAAPVIDSFLEPHTWQEWRKTNPEAFPPEHEDLWKGLDAAAERAMAEPAKKAEEASRSIKSAARRTMVHEERAATSWLDGFVNRLRGGVQKVEIALRADGTRGTGAVLHGFVTRAELKQLVAGAIDADPRWGTRVNGVRALELPGKRFIAWEGTQGFHGNVLDDLNEMLKERGLKQLNSEDVKNIFIPVTRNRAGNAVAGNVEIAESVGERVWAHTSTVSFSDFSKEVEDFSASGPAFDKRVRDSNTRAQRLIEETMTGGADTEGFRASVDQALTLASTKKLTNASGQVLHTNREKVMSRGLQYDPSLDGFLPSAVKNAYFRMVELSNLAHLMRSEDMYLGKAVRGMQSLSFHAGRGIIEDMDGVVYRASNVPAVPSSRVYNITDDLHYVAKVDAQVKEGTAYKAGTAPRLTDADINRMVKKEGYIMVRLEQPIQVRGGVTVQWVMGKAQDFEVKPLKFEQLGYVPGGSRGYKDRHFAKQVNMGKQADNGEDFLMNPHTFIVGTRAEVEAWTKTMEEARAIYNNTEGERRTTLLSNLLDNAEGFPSGADFEQMVKNGEFNPEYPVEALYDREQPSDYAKFRTRGWEDMSDPEESGINTYMQTHGKMYYSPKGQVLKDWRGQDATLIDPFQMMNKSLSNIASMSSLSDYKMRSIEKWIKTFGPYLDLRGIPRDASPVRIFQESVFLKDVPEAQKIKNAAEAQRDTIKRLLGWRSDVDREFDYMGRQLVDFVAGDKPGSWRNKTFSRGMEWTNDANPVSKARKMAHHMKLGLFNVAQFPMQISTMLAAISIDPVKGLHAFSNLPAMIGYLAKNGDEAWLDFWIKQGWHKASGFSDPEEYKAMMRAAKKSGFFDIGGTHQLVNYNGVDAAMGAIGRGPVGEMLNAAGRVTRQVTEKGTFFFNEAERWNRVLGWQIGWRRTAEMGLTPGTPKFFEKVNEIAHDFTFNMSAGGAAAWQKGWTSIPTQFLSYQARMLEAMTGKQFTRAERLRLLLGQAVLYGTAGVPFAAFLSEKLRGDSGEAPKIGTWEGLADRGLIDTLIWVSSGADVQYGERAATGAFITDTVRELFGMSKYGETSFVDIMGGPLYGVTKEVAGSFWNVVKYVSAESGGDTGLALTSSSVMNLAKQISSFNNAYKAYMVWNYGQYVTKTGKVALDDLPSTDAFAVFLGLTPGEYRDYVAKQDWRRNRQDTVNEISGKIVEFRTRLWREEGNSDAIASEMELFRKMTPEDVWIDALNMANRSKTSESIYDGIARRWEIEKQQQQLGKMSNTDAQ